jgi:pimeloyl-ACP methyl ester carboxylesterase
VSQLESRLEWIGSGEPLILLHGWGKTKEILRPLAELLAHGYRVGLLDLPGFGKTEAPAEPWGTEQYAEWVAAQIPPSCNLLGHSLGARIAIQLAHRHPDRIKRLILVGAAGLRTRSFKRRVRLNAIRALRTGVRALDRTLRLGIESSWYRPRFGSRDYNQAGAMRPTLVRIVNEDLAPLLPQISHPSLLLWGTQDPETPPEMGRRMASALPASQLIWMEGKGHEPYEGAGAQLCARYIERFLNGGDNHE